MPSLAQLSSRYAALWIFLVAWVLRTLFVGVALDAGTDFTLTKDSPRYDRLALNLLHRGQFNAEPFSLAELDLAPDFEHRVLRPGYLTGSELFSGPEVKRLPAFPGFLAAVYGLCGYDPRIVLWLQALIGALTCWLVYRIGRDAGSRTLGLVASGLLAVNPRSILHTGQLQVETFFIALLVVVVWLGLRQAARPTTLRSILFSLALLSLVLSREMGMLMPAVFLPLIIAPLLGRHLGGRWRRAGKAALVIAIPVLGILGWMARNHSHYGVFAWTAHTPFTEAWHFGPRILAAAWDVPEREAQDRIFKETLASHPEHEPEYRRFLADPNFSVWEFNHSLVLNRHAARVARAHLLEHWPTAVRAVVGGAAWSLWSGVGEWRGIVVSNERYKAAVAGDRVKRAKKALYQLRPAAAFDFMRPVFSGLGGTVLVVFALVAAFFALLYGAAGFGVLPAFRLHRQLTVQLVVLVLFAGFVSGPAGNNRLFAIAYPFLSLLAAAGLERMLSRHPPTAGSDVRA